MQNTRTQTPNRTQEKKTIEEEREKINMNSTSGIRTRPIVGFRYLCQQRLGNLETIGGIGGVAVFNL